MIALDTSIATVRGPNVAHALMPAVSALMPTRCCAGGGRREESRRGTHECVRHDSVRLELA
jgi:hypothetical protein